MEMYADGPSRNPLGCLIQSRGICIFRPFQGLIEAALAKKHFEDPIHPVNFRKIHQHMKKLCILFVALLLLASCSRSVEGETSAWASNKTRLNELKALYPGFSAALESMMGQAESAWNAASSISNEDEKIAKMAEANALIGSGWVGDLGAIDSQKRKLRDEASRLNSKAKTPADRMNATSINSSASMTVSRVESDLRMGAADAAGAAAIVRRATEDLRSAQKMVDDMESNLRKSTSTTTTAGGSNDTKPADVEPATWTCGYCSKTNDKSAHECGGCGAQKK
jgi:hypothetical protein